MFVGWAWAYFRGSLTIIDPAKTEFSISRITRTRDTAEWKHNLWWSAVPIFLPGIVVVSPSHLCTHRSVVLNLIGRVGTAYFPSGVVLTAMSFIGDPITISLVGVLITYALPHSINKTYPTSYCHEVST